MEFESTRRNPPTMTSEAHTTVLRWPQHCQTRDGVEYHIRPIRADDAERDCLFIKHLSDTSRYNRMMGASHGPSPDLLNRLVHVDYRRDMALVAVVGKAPDETIIGVARYAAVPLSGGPAILQPHKALQHLPPHRLSERFCSDSRTSGIPAHCEFAIAVADEWQSRGVGFMLARLLFSYARAHGVQRLSALIFANNVRMLRLAERLQMTLRRSADDDSVVEAELEVLHSRYRLRSGAASQSP